METKTPGLNSLPKKAKILIILAIGIPAVVALIFTEMQWYPATIIIEKLADEKGLFPMKRAILLNMAALMLCELAVILPVLVIKKLFFEKKADR
jgi:hypothetical protein